MKQIVLGGAPKRKNPPQPQKKRRRRRTGRQALNYILLLLVAAAIMVALSMTVLFHVSAITTDGLTKYAPQALIDACGVKEGDNLLRINERTVRRKILAAFPYVEELKLRRVLPDKLVLQVTEAAVLGACEYEGSYVIVGETGRILETGASSVPEDAMEVYGMYLYEPEVGRVLGQFTKEQQDKLKKEKEAASKAASAAAEKASKSGTSSAASVPTDAELFLNGKSEQETEAAAFQTLSDLVAAVEETGFRNITMVDLSDSLNTAVVYDNRVLIELGSVADLSYKLQFVTHILEKQLPAGFQGVIDASYLPTSKTASSMAGDITEKLQSRRAKATENQEPDDLTGLKPKTAQSSGNEASSEEEGNPLLALKPKKEEPDASSAASSSQTSSNESSAADESADEENASSMTGPYSPDMLALKPGPKITSSDAGESSSENASE